MPRYLEDLVAHRALNLLPIALADLVDDRKRTGLDSHLERSRLDRSISESRLAGEFANRDGVIVSQCRKKPARERSNDKSTLPGIESVASAVRRCDGRVGPQGHCKSRRSLEKARRIR